MSYIVFKFLVFELTCKKKSGLKFEQFTFDLRDKVWIVIASI